MGHFHFVLVQFTNVLLFPGSMTKMLDYVRLVLEVSTSLEENIIVDYVAQ